MKIRFVFIILALILGGCKKESSLYDENVLLKNSIDTYISAKEELTEKQARILEIEHYKKPSGRYDLIRKLNGKELIHLCNSYLSSDGKIEIQKPKYEIFDWELGDYTLLESDYNPSMLASWRNYGAEHYEETVAWEYSINGSFCTKDGLVNKKAILLIILFKGMMIINQ